MKMSKKIQAQIDVIQWFHHFDEETFGFETKGAKGTPNKEEIKLWGFTPEMFKGKTVLDIGAWDGYYSFYAEKMGAKRVLAIDHPCWSGDDWGTKEGFDLAHRLLGSNVESLDIDLYDITTELIGKFDVVLFTGLLNHLTNPIAGLNCAKAVTNETLILETPFEDHASAEPVLIYKPDRFKDDSGSFYSPNKSRLTELLVDICGFRKVTIVDQPQPQDRLVCYAIK